MFSLLLALLVPRYQVPLADVSFELVGNHIFVPATVNGQRMTALFDSGAAVSIIDSDVADRWQLAWSGTSMVAGVGPATVTGRVLTDTTVKIGDVEERLWLTLPLYGLSKAEGRPVTLVVGYEFFKDDIVQIDYPNKRLRIFPGGWKPDSEGTVLPIHLVQNCPHITTQMAAGDDTFNLETLIDTGASRGTLSTRFLSNYTINTKRTVKSLLGGGIGGQIEGWYLRPGAIGLGNQVVTKPILSAVLMDSGSLGFNSTYDLLLGGDILSRFKVTFDYADSWMMLEPGSGLSAPFEADKAGLRLESADGNLRVYRVAGVMGGSSGAEAGMLIGDYIEMIDGKPAALWSLPELRELFRSPTAKGWDLKVHRGNELRTIHITAKSVI